MIDRMKDLKPLVACFNGKGYHHNVQHLLTFSFPSVGIYEIFSGKKCEVGIQPETLPGTGTVR